MKRRRGFWSSFCAFKPFTKASFEEKDVFKTSFVTMPFVTMKAKKMLTWVTFRAFTVSGKKKTFPESGLAFWKGLLFYFQGFKLGRRADAWPAAAKL